MDAIPPRKNGFNIFALLKSNSISASVVEAIEPTIGNNLERLCPNSWCVLSGMTIFSDIGIFLFEIKIGLPLIQS